MNTIYTGGYTPILWWLILLSIMPLPLDVQTINESTGKVPILIGLDAHRMWNHWPTQRIGARAYLRSTCDRRGGNESADASRFLYMGKNENNNVTLDVLGKGVLYFVRTNHRHESPGHYKVDGKDYVVKETGTAHPNQAKKLQTTIFIPSKAFPKKFLVLSTLNFSPRP